MLALRPLRQALLGRHCCGYANARTERVVPRPSDHPYDLDDLGEAKALNSVPGAGENPRVVGSTPTLGTRLTP